MTQTTKKPLAKLLASAGLFSAVVLCVSAAPAMAQQRCETPEGSWVYTVSIPMSGAAPIVFQGVETYDAGGGYSEADELGIIPGYLATAGHGVWKSTAKRDFLLTYRNLTYDATGNPTGSSRVRQTTTMSHDCYNYSGSGDFFYYDVKGNETSTGTFTITSKRILVEEPQ